MSYSSENILPQETREKDLINFIKLLDYEYLGSWNGDELGKIKSFHWFNRKDYKSWYGVELSVYEHEGQIRVETRTNISRSYYDLEHQNKTIQLIRKYFKGEFYTDEGKSRYLNVDTPPPEHSQSGCHLAFSAFGSNLIRVAQYIEARNFGTKKLEPTGVHWIDRTNPNLLSNLLVLPFIASIAEDYWKSTYIALFKYCENKEAILKSNRISAERLAQISNNEISIEEAFAESISFGRISIVCKHFKAIDKKLDFAGVLMKPYKRRKKTLFDSLEELTDIRNQIIHQASSPIMIDDDYIKESYNILHDSIERCYKFLTDKKGWYFGKTWHTGKMK